MKRELAEHSFRMKSLAAAVGLLSGGAHALDFEVTNLSDSGDGSLRWAIDQAQSNEGPDNITFASSVSGAINLQSPLPMITEGLSITGPGITLNAAGISNPYGGEPPVINIYSANPYAPFSLSGLTIRGSDSGAVRAGFYYTEGSVSLSNMVITGNTERTAIQVRRANLTIADSVITGNAASQDTGAMAFEYGTLSVTDTEITNNTLDTGEGMAGAVALRYANATIERTSITGNTSGASAGGIGMRDTSLVLRNSSVDNNVAAGDGGGVMSGGGFRADLEVENSSISGNQAGVSSGGGYYFEGPRGGSGGAIAMAYSFPPATSISLSSSIISGNSASRSGGAIRFSSGNFSAYGSKISDNSARYGGAFDMRVVGGVIFGSTISGNTAEDGAVGAIQVERSYGFYGPVPLALAGPSGPGVFSIDSSTISGNSLTGDVEDAVTLFAYIDRNAELVIENSTISNNPATGPVVEVYSDSRYASFTMRNSTMSGNSSSSSQSVMLVENVSDVQLANNTFVDNNATLPSLVSGETAQVSLHNSLYQRYEGGPYYGPYIYGQMNVSVSGNAMTSSNDKEMLVGGLPAGASPYSESGDPVAADLTSNIMANGVTIAANSTNDGEAPDMVDPQLGALSMQGGFTAVHMPLAGSPAINGGDTTMRPDGRDQRGLSAIIGNFDIGSVEVSSNTAPSLTINLPKQIGGFVGKEIPSFVLVDLYEDAEGDNVIIEGVYGLPAGLTWDGTNIAGTLEQAGSYLVTVVARDDREDSLEAVTQVEVVVTETAPVRKDDDDDDFLGSVPLGGLALLGFLAALRRRRS